MKENINNQNDNNILNIEKENNNNYNKKIKNKLNENFLNINNNNINLNNICFSRNFSTKNKNNNSLKNIKNFHNNISFGEKTSIEFDNNYNENNNNSNSKNENNNINNIFVKNLSNKETQIDSMTSRIPLTCSLNCDNNNYNNNDENDNLSEKDFFELCKKKFLNNSKNINKSDENHQNGKNFSCDNISICNSN